MIRRVVLLLFSACDVLVAAQEAEITIPPQPINTSVNGEAGFNCTAFANGFVWKANEVQLDSREGVVILTAAVNKALNIRTSTLRMAVSSTDNATNITCIAVSQTPPSSDASDQALLLVQGVLESVRNLTMAVINSTTALISWSPPSTLEGIPILGYIITIISTASSNNNESMLAAGNTTMLYYTIDYNDNNNITVTVIVLPINEAGDGQSTFTTINILSPQVPLSSVLALSTSVVIPERPLTMLMTATKQANLISVPTATTDYFNNHATSLLSTVEVVLVTVPPVITSILLLTIVLGLLLCCLRRRQIKRKETRADLKDVIMMNDSPAYAVVKRHTQQRLELCENSAYGVVK